MQSKRVVLFEKGAVAKNLRFRDSPLHKTHRSSSFQHKQAEKNVYFYSQSVLMVNGRLIQTILLTL
jgi:hypothetical protein